MLKLTYGLTFRDYAINIFVTYFPSLLRQVECVDLYEIDTLDRVWINVREKNVELGNCPGNCPFPTNWMTFLRCSETKAESFPYLSIVVVKEI